MVVTPGFNCYFWYGGYYKVVVFSTLVFKSLRTHLTPEFFADFDVSAASRENGGIPAGQCP